jgi:two-component system LytT family response regulator
MFSQHGYEPNNHLEKIVLTDQRKMVILHFTDLIRVEGDGSYCTVYSSTHPPILLSRNLGSLISQLPEWLFFRTHQSHLINIKMVREIDRECGCSVLLNDGSSVPVARRRKDELMRVMLN